ncbi:MAG: hypothetical protein A2040_01220 [Rhodocyclales bacterium GWA2_65_19]|nr:MAG: hypothetical protein A2040_01220 [Rhodocyclales bacterium GWA2_65_19]
MSADPRQRFILLATASYTGLALAWIFLSDQLLAGFADLNAMVWLSTAKGVFFVVVSASAFYFALRAVPATAAAGSGSLMETLAAGVAPGVLPRWLTYLFAVAVTLSVLLVRDSLAAEVGDQPLLMLFMFPIILSALLGGLGPGLAATAVAALGVDYFAIPPLHSLRIAAAHDLMQWSFLLVNGVAVSLLSEALRQSLSRAEMNRRLLDVVISRTPDAVFVKDTLGRYLLANDATAGFVGRAPGEIVGCDDRALFPDATARELMALDAAIMGAGRTQTHEEHLTTRDGRELVFLATKGPVHDGAGRVMGLFGVSRDITDRRRAEDEIRRLNAQLERRATESGVELQAANRELEDLAYAVTHNLRAPLRAIGGFAQVLVEDHAARLDAAARGSLDQIMQGCELMGCQLDGILTLLRCTRGELRRTVVDMSALATRRLDELARAEPKRQVLREVAAGLVATGDQAMLDMVLIQLLRNAWKFTRDREDAAIRVLAGELDGRPGICVADNGAGFDMAHVQGLFRPFQRLHRQDEFPGIGIGLATVQRIIHRHGGEIRGEGRPGAGAKFCFTLPASVAKETP